MSRNDNGDFQRHDFRNIVNGGANLQGSVLIGENSKIQAAKQHCNNFIGPPENELVGLSVEEKKRKRNRPFNEVVMLSEDISNAINPETVISNILLYWLSLLSRLASPRESLKLELPRSG